MLKRRLAELHPTPEDLVDVEWVSRRSGQKQRERIPSIAWWFHRLTDLRNALMHGRLPDPDDWLHEGVRHVDRGEWELRRSIKLTIARDDHPDILEDLAWREALRTLRAERNADTASGAEAVDGEALG